MPLRIRDLREDSDLSQKEIAKFLHVSQATYSRYENGELEISNSYVDRIGGFLSYKCGLFTGADGIARDPHPR